MGKKLVAAINELLDTIEHDAEGGYAEGSARVFNEKIWKKYDPDQYRQWKAVKTLMKSDGSA